MLAALALAYMIIGPNGALEAVGTTAATAPVAPTTTAASKPASPPGKAVGTTAATASTPKPAPRPQPPPAPDHCSVPANLPPDPSVAYQPLEGPLPADLPGPTFKLPDKINVPLNLYLPPPAPFGTEINIGKATIDLKTGGVAINGQEFAPGPGACP